MFTDVGGGTIAADLTHWSKNTTSQSFSYDMYLLRKVSSDDLNNMDLDTMPGFQFSWKYNKQVASVDKYSKENKTKQFVRYNIDYSVTKVCLSFRSHRCPL